MAQTTSDRPAGRNAENTTSAMQRTATALRCLLIGCADSFYLIGPIDHDDGDVVGKLRVHPAARIGDQ